MSSQSPTPNILMIGATHGDEPIGIRALCALSARAEGFDWIIGNPPAYRNNTRAFEGDLNRSAPGDAASTDYAKRRAAKILEFSASYNWTIDLHGTSAYTGIFIILTKITPANLRLAARLDIPRLVYWPSITPELKGPMSEFFPCGLEIECGPQNMPVVEEKLVGILEQFLAERTDEMSDDEARNRLAGRELYEVSGVCKTPMEGLEEFTPVLIEGKEVYPLLINLYPDVTCHTMKRKTLDDWWK